MNYLPTELLVHEIGRYLTTEDEIRLSRVNKRFNSIFVNLANKHREQFTLNKLIRRPNLRIFYVYTHRGIYTLIVSFYRRDYIRYTLDKWKTYIDVIMNKFYIDVEEHEITTYFTVIPPDEESRHLIKPVWFAFYNIKRGYPYKRIPQYWDNNHGWNYSTSSKDEFITKIYIKDKCCVPIDVIEAHLNRFCNIPLDCKEYIL